MRGPYLLALLLLSACGGEPDFDERYRRKAEDLETAATAMQQELANRMAASTIAETAETAEAAPPSPATGGKEEKAR